MKSIDPLIHAFEKLPSLGRRGATRIVLQIIKNPEKMMLPLADIIKKTASSIVSCKKCYNIDTSSPCSICTDAKRDSQTICIVETVADLWAMESTGSYRGLYFVLGDHLSALAGTGPEDLHIPELLQRIKNEDITEVIFALPATVEGQMTRHYIQDSIDQDIKITALSTGIPLGGQLDYIDSGTLTTALIERR